MTNNNWQRKEIFLAAYKANFFNISKSCKAADIARITYYDWKDKDPDFAQALEDAHVDQIKWVEEQMFKRIEEGSDRLTEFYLKTKGKKEGYGDKQEIQHNITHNPIQIIFGDEEINGTRYNSN